MTWEEFYQTVRNKPVPIGYGSWYAYWRSVYCGITHQKANVP